MWLGERYKTRTTQRTGEDLVVARERASMIRVLELFAGIGACSKALDRIGIKHKIVDAVEIDKYAIKSFNAVHGTNFEPQDITKWDKDIECDLIMHGSPCQDFSVAGKQAGGDKDSGTRSSLMYETLRIVKKLKPKYVIWENVKNLLSEKHRHNYFAYIDSMAKLGYKSFGRVLNAKDFGVPQNRERIFTISILGDAKFQFPEPRPLNTGFKDILEQNVEEKYYLADERLKKVANVFTVAKNEPIPDNFTRVKRLGGLHDRDGKIHQAGSIYDVRGLCPTLYTMQGGNTEPKIVTTKHDKMAIRKLTPKECWRLMGFDDEDFERAAKENSNTQLYKQAGNSIVVDVLEGILTNLLKEVE